MKRREFDWNQARAFLVAAEEGTLSAAARALKLTQPTLSRQVAGLEEALGITLFERTPRSLVLTRAGAEVLEHFRNMGYAADQISTVATGQTESLVGHVAITATDMMVTQYLLPIFNDFRRTSPELTVEFVVTNELSDLRGREADIAIRHARTSDKKLIAKQLRSIEASLFVSKQYIKKVGRPSQASDIRNMTFVGAVDHKLLLGLLSSRGLNLSPANFNFHTDNGTVLLELVRQGFGVGVLPIEVAERYRELEVVWPRFEPVQIEAWLVSHRELLNNPRIRFVYDLLEDKLS